MSTQTMQATRTNPIDLTGDDEDDSAYANPGIIRSRAAGAASHNTIQLPFGGPTMAPAAVVAGQLGPPTYSSSSSSSSSPSYNRHNHSSSPTMATVHSNPYGRSEHSGQPGFGAPRTALPSGFTALPPNNGISPAFAAPGRSGTLTATNGAGRAVIDLTSSSTPSPPPHPHLQHQHQHPHPHQHGMTPTLAPVPELPPDLPLKTPICIGQLVVTALVLYPISYLAPSEHGGPDSEWACVRTQYEHNPSKPLASQETIHIKSPNYRTANGETRNGENFGVVEQKVATAIGPMLGKGLIRIEGRVRRGRPNVSAFFFQIYAHILKIGSP
jgi:SWI/SNF-related matrix-associated actin-dependent regulator of chromatin subfamily A3